MSLKLALRSGILLIAVAFVPLAALAANSVGSSQSAAQLLIEALQNPAPASTTTPPAIIHASETESIQVPIGVSLPSFGTNNFIIPQAPVTATTTAANTSTTLLQSLLAELETLEAQIAALEGQNATTTPQVASTASTSCTPVNLTTPLSPGSTGSEVTSLQQFLQAQGFYTYPSITGYFGPVTETAVEAFQSANNIVSSGTASSTGYGLVGPKTAAKIDALSSSCTSTAQAPSATTVASTTPGLIAPITPGYGGGGGSTSGGGGGGPSTNPPAISSISAVATTTSSTITWTTDQPSNSEVVYGLTASYGASSSTASLVASHSIILTGLATSTTYHYAVVSTNANNQTSTSSDQTFTTSNGVNPTPSVSLTVPTSGATVGGASVTLTATASESGGSIQSVQFKVEGTNINAAVTNSPYTTIWNSTAVSDGAHTLYAVAKDASGNYATSSISVTVDNTAPIISSISSGTPGQTTTTITWTTNENASSEVIYGPTTSYGSSSSTASLVTSHSISLSSLSSGTAYHFAVVSADVVGNTSTSSDQTFTTASSDTQPPTAPTNLTAVAASLSELDLSWTASTDNVGVVGYKILRDGTQVATDTSGTIYADTGLAASSTHTYVVKAYDAAGNVSSTSNTATSTTGVWADGFAGAPSGEAEHPALLEGYNTRAPWHVAGVDYAVGYPANTTLLDWENIPTQGGNVVVNTSTNHVRFLSTASSCAVNGYDFSLHGGAILEMDCANPTITNDNFSCGSNCIANIGGSAIINFVNGSCVASPGTITIVDNVIDGGSQNNLNEGTLIDVNCPNIASLVVKYNWLKNFSQQVLDTGQGFPLTYEYNLIDEGAFATGAHLNYLQFGNGTYSPTVAFNTSYQTPQASGGEGYQLYAVSGTSTLANPTVTNNTLIASGTNAMSYMIHGNCHITSDCATTQSVITGPGLINNNYFDQSGAAAAFYPSGGGNMWLGWTLSNNFDMTTGAALVTNP